MKSAVYIILLFVLVCSCTQVINIDLNSSNPKLVVQADITTSPGPYTFTLSQTTNYFGTNTLIPRSGALIIITDNKGTLDTAKELQSGTGIYTTSKIEGKTETVYNLLIVSQSQKYTATNSIPDSVSMDSLGYSPTGSINPNYKIRCVFQDPPTPGNYYAFRIHKKGKLLSDIVNNQLVSDQLLNGYLIPVVLQNGHIKTGDTITVDLVSMGKADYDYFNTLQQTIDAGKPFSSLPANPLTNLNNNALGFFGAYSFTARSVVMH